MKQKLKLIIDASKIKERGKNNNVHAFLFEINKKIPDEMVGSATFSLALDLATTKSKLFSIPQKPTSNKLYITFKKK